MSAFDQLSQETDKIAAVLERRPIMTAINTMQEAPEKRARIAVVEEEP